MAYQVHRGPVGTSETVITDHSANAFNAYRVLHFGFTLLPIVAGLDKFFRLLTPWEKYLMPEIPAALGMKPFTIMLGIGIIEVIAGIITMVKPRIGGFILAFWLALIVVNLLFHPARYFDIALRDFGLMLGALALAWLSRDFEVRREIVEIREVTP